MRLYEACLAKFGVVAAVMIITDISGFMSDFNRATDEELKELLEPLNADKETKHTFHGYSPSGVDSVAKCLTLPYEHATSR